MIVDMHEFRTATHPDILETTGAGPCVIVALAYRKRGFLLHSPDPLVEWDRVVIPFFQALDKHVPRDVRPGIRPLLAGAAFDDNDAEADDGGVRESTMNARWEIRDALRKAGFSNVLSVWGKPGESHSVTLDLDTEAALLEIDSAEGKREENISFSIRTEVG